MNIDPPKQNGRLFSPWIVWCKAKHLQRCSANRLFSPAHDLGEAGVLGADVRIALCVSHSLPDAKETGRTTNTCEKCMKGKQMLLSAACMCVPCTPTPLPKSRSNPAPIVGRSDKKTCVCVQSIRGSRHLFNLCTMYHPTPQKEASPIAVPLIFPFRAERLEPRGG